MSAGVRRLHPIPEGVEATPGVLEVYARFGGSYRWLVAFVSTAGSFCTLLASTIVNVAIPDMMGALGMTLDDAQWLVTAFLASGTVTMLLTAWCIRAFGIAKTYTAAMLFFIAGSILGSAAETPDAMFFARVVQGASSGVVMPISMIMVAQVFPVRSRGMAMGLMGVGTILAPALGPTLGGYLVDNFSWRWVFVMAIPLVTLTIPLAIWVYPGREETGPWPRFDWWGVILCSVYLLAALMCMAAIGRYGWYDDRVTITLSVGVVGFVAWILWELRAPEPILDLRLFLNLRWVAAAIITCIVSVGLFCSTYLFPLYLQTIASFTPTDAGLIMAPAGIMMAVLFPVAGFMADKFSARKMIVLGLVVFALSNYPMAFADANTPAIDLIIWFLYGRIGLACLFPSLNATSVNVLKLEDIPNGSGAINFLRQLGGALGVGAVSLAYSQRVAHHADYSAVTQSWGNASTMEMLRLVQEQFGFLGLQGYLGFETSFGYIMQVVSKQSAMLAYRDGFVIIGLIVLVSLIPACFVQGRRPEPAAPVSAS